MAISYWMVSNSTCIRRPADYLKTWSVASVLEVVCNSFPILRFPELRARKSQDVAAGHAPGEHCTLQ